LLRVLNRAFGDPLKNEERAVAPLAGGIMQYGYQCGMIWGAALAAGAQVYRIFGAGAKAEAKAIEATQKILESFHTNYHNIDCYEITGIDKSSSVMDMIKFFVIKGGTIGCFKMSASYSKKAFSEIKSSLSETSKDTPPLPVSCSAMLAANMGASDNQKVMAAGLAGGIGLCGGACGALGAAIWITGIKKLKTDGGKIDFNSPEMNKIVEIFLKCTDFEFECSKIVGKKFHSVQEHANYLREGGCAKIVDLLANYCNKA
jgi:hypothetical protein